MKNILRLLIIAPALSVPLFASADKIQEFGTLITSINTTIVSAVATLFMACATVAFFYGMAMFIIASRDGEEKAITNGKQFMLWSVIALFVMFSIYGIIRFAQGVIGIEGKTNIVIPTFQIGGAAPGSNIQTPANTNPGNRQTPTNGSLSTCKTIGETCTVSGRPGTCGMNEEEALGCYANTNTGTATRDNCASNPNVCDSNEVCAVKPGSGTSVKQCYVDPNL